MRSKVEIHPYVRVLDIARGAVLMSVTTHDIEFIEGSCEVLPNNTVSNPVLQKTQVVNDLSFAAEERRFARQLQVIRQWRLPRAVPRRCHVLSIVAQGEEVVVDSIR